MSEEFLSDIIGEAKPEKTEAEMIADLTGSPDEVKPTEVVKEPVAEVEMKSEATPDEAQDADDKAPVVESDDVKALATQLGWREDHTGDDAVDASTYILKSKDIQKSMSQNNKALKEQLNGLGGSIEALKKHNETVYKSEVKKLTNELTALKKERRSAIELADVDKVDELDQQIDSIQKDIDAPKPVEKQTTTSDNPAFDTWIADNQWYNDDDEMASFADTVAQQYVGAPLDRVYALVRSKIQEVFPEKFESAKPAVPATPAPVVKTPVGPASPVERSSAKVTGESFTKADLSGEQLAIMNQFVKMGIMTEDAYVADIAKTQ